jgi:hypothetical protein
MVKKVFSIDSHKSKIGNDEDTVVLCFIVEEEDPAKDLENFIEMGYEFVLDADVTPGETEDGVYQVFVEIERSKHVAEQIFEIIEGVKQLAELDDMRFRYFKSFKSHPADIDMLTAFVPKDRVAYELSTKRNRLDNFSEFFKNSYADKLIVDESIKFKNSYSGTVIFDILNSGSKREIYDSIKGPIVLEGKHMAEVMFLTKTIGNYNINKIGDTFIFENGDWAVALKRKA